MREAEAVAAMSVQVAAPAVELKELSGPMEKGCEAGAVPHPSPGAPCSGAEREAATAAERPPPGAVKVPQASAMKRSDPHHPQHRHRDGGVGVGGAADGGAAAEALVSPDGTVSEAPRTVKKVWGEGGPPRIVGLSPPKLELWWCLGARLVAPPPHRNWHCGGSWG